MKNNFVREYSLSRRDCVYKSVSLFGYSEEEQAAVRRARQKRSRATLPKVKALNDRRSREMFEWIVHNNFAKGDYFATLTFAEKITAQDGKRLLCNFIRSLRRLCKRSGAELKYMYVEEYGETSGLYHIHMLIGSADGFVAKRSVIQLWKNGICDVKRINNTSEDLCALCNYLVKQKSSSKYKRLWNCSQSCKRPEIVRDDNRISVTTMRKMHKAAQNGELIAIIERIYKGWRVISVPESGVNEVTGRFYVRFRLMRTRKRTKLRIDYTEQQYLRRNTLRAGFLPLQA